MFFVFNGCMETDARKTAKGGAPMQKLTKSMVERAEIKDKPYFIFDSQLPGFSVRISPSGKRNYYVQYLWRKKIQRMPLGQHGVLTTEQARDKALKIVASVKDGENPQGEKIKRSREPIIHDLARRYLDEHAKLHCKPRTVKGYERYLEKFILPAIGNLRVSEVSRADIANFHHDMRDTPYDANRCLEVISKMFNLAELWGLRADGTNPRRHIPKYGEQKRERYLTDEELQRLGSVLEEAETKKTEPLPIIFSIRLLLLTGCRLGEIQTLKWSYIDFTEGCLRLPDSKTGAKIVHVGPAVINLLRTMQEHDERPEGNPYVIYGTIPLKYRTDIQKPWRRLREKAALSDLRIHDLRHSFASLAVSSGQSLAMIGKLLGHTQVQTTARYAHLMSDTVKSAAKDVSAQIAQKLVPAHVINQTHIPINTIDQALAAE